jgi:hypothetical protein
VLENGQYDTYAGRGTRRLDVAFALVEHVTEHVRPERTLHGCVQAVRIAWWLRRRSVPASENAQFAAEARRGPQPFGFIGRFLTGQFFDGAGARSLRRRTRSGGKFRAPVRYVVVGP